MTRRNLDQYFTPVDAIHQLLDNHRIVAGTVLEPCCGEGAISNVIEARSGDYCSVQTNDLDHKKVAGYHLDVSTPESWDSFVQPDWVITNPPFNLAPKILPLAYEFATKGVAMLLRLSYLEPCLNRVDWLQEHPLSGLYVLPRISFTLDGRTDRVCTAWFVWEKDYYKQGYGKQVIKILSK